MTRPPEVAIPHAYPAALGFVNRHGPEALAVLDDLVAHAEVRDHQLVVAASVRQVAERLVFTSKDTVNRRLRQLQAAGVIRRVPTSTRFACPTYTLHLADTGISRAVTPSRSA
ncbi:MAG: hypothetical protein ACRD0D_13510 [Acidimicrobiales bacterium]